MKKLKMLIVLSAVALVSAFALAAEPLGSWLSELQPPTESWRTGKLAAIANGYKQRFTANPSDYEARVFHAATILVQLGENKNVATYAKKFGFTLDYLGMNVKSSSSAPSSWAQPNVMVDTFVKEGVPVLKDALADLEAIPTDWSGVVHLSPNDFPVDDDVDIDIGDILYARAGIEATIGLAYFAHGYDLTADYAKGKKALESRRTIQALPRAPNSEWDEMWESVSDGAECEGGLSSFKIGYVGKKIYIRAEGEMAEVIGDGDHAIRSIYLELEDSSEEPVWSLLLTDDPNGHMQQDDHYTARVFNASEADTWYWWDFSKKTVPVSMKQSGGACQFEIDLSKYATYAKSGTWTVSWGQVSLYTEWNEYPYYDYSIDQWCEGWWDCDWSNLGSLDDMPLTLYKFFTEQTKFMAKVRNQSSLPTSKAWMKTALNRALLADEAVRNRTDDAMHFVEYDPVDADVIARARNLTEKALASLDATQEVDVLEEVLDGHEPKFDVSLLPNDGLMQVYLGALFEGKITRDLLPAFNQGIDEGPVPVIETIKDPTFGGLLPDFTAKTWSRLVQNMGYEVAHQTISLKLDGNGGKLPQGTPATVSLVFDEESEECYYPELPVPTRAGFIFTGWATAKAGGTIVRWGDGYDAAPFAGVKTPALYAQWLKFYTFTVKGENAYASWEWSEEQTETLPQEAFDGEYVMEVNAKGSMNVPEGAVVSVLTAEKAKDKNGDPLTFQKWTVSSTKANLGPSFFVTSPRAQLAMPAENLTLTATYIDESTCGWVSPSASASSIELGDGGAIEPPYSAFEWSPDNGKTWYKSDEAAMLKKGSYTVTWRSSDPCWQAPTAKTKVNVAVEREEYAYGNFTFIPQVVVDVMTFENGGCDLSSAGGSVTMNPKDGLVPAQKSITLTAKASDAKKYVFQGYAFRKIEAGEWHYELGFDAAAATWKLENSLEEAEEFCSIPEPLLYKYIDSDDHKVHIVAVFKALSAYSPDDIAFSGLYGENGAYNKVSDDGSSVDVRAVVGCSLPQGYGLGFNGAASFPLTFKLNGKLPAGLKFDAKTGVFSGAPSKAGSAPVTITATDPAKNSKDLTVNFTVDPLPTWVAGDFRAVGSDCLLEMSVTSAGKVSAKLLTRLGTRSISGTLSWTQNMDDPEGDGTFGFNPPDTKNGESCSISFNPDGTINGYADSYLKSNGWAGDEVSGRCLDKAMLQNATAILDKYYTFRLDSSLSYAPDDSYSSTAGYGYLTIKTDKKGSAKVTGQLADGEKVSVSGLLLPVDEGYGAMLYLFASPSSYKKEGCFVMSLYLSDGYVNPMNEGSWTVSSGARYSVSGYGTEYSAASDLDGYYWTISCASSESVQQEYSWKEPSTDDNGKPVSYTVYDNAPAVDLGGLFTVSVMGDKKGSIVLAGKSSAPWQRSWKEDGVTYKEWDYYTDKNENPITNPSQLSIAFTKATGIFTGKATVYFDYELPSWKKNRDGEYDVTYTQQHKTASVPYAGVMIVDGESRSGYGAAIYTYKHTYVDEETGRSKSVTDKVSLPVTLE